MWNRLNDMDRMFGAMDLLRSQLNRSFWDVTKPLGDDFGWRITDGTPCTNLYDTGEQLEVTAELPGMAKADLNIRIQGNYLELSGTRHSDAPEGYKTHRQERGTATFTRSFTLPTEVDVEKVDASLNNGILALKLPKAEAAKPKQIAIK
jgi:HSP20 family protein